MKANHNQFRNDISDINVVGNINKSKNESKSQHGNTSFFDTTVVGNINKSKNESKSQPVPINLNWLVGCGQYQ